MAIERFEWNGKPVYIQSNDHEALQWLLNLSSGILQQNRHLEAYSLRLKDLTDQALADVQEKDRKARAEKAAQPQPRIGQAERDAAMTELSEHYAAGRLWHAELEERAGIAARALYQSELDKLLEDMPELKPQPEAALQPVPAARRSVRACPPLGLYYFIIALGMFLAVAILAW